jgi:AraC family transcriptional regulator
LDRVEARLRIIEKEGSMPEHEIVTKQIDPVSGVGCRDRMPITGIAEFIGDVMGGVMMNGLAPSAPPMVLYHDPEFDPEAVDATFLVPIVGEPSGTTPAGRTLEAVSVPGGEMAVVIHVGPYESIGEAYQALGAWFAAEGRTGAGPACEVYLTRPEDPGDPVTEIRMALAP